MVFGGEKGSRAENQGKSRHEADKEEGGYYDPLLDGRFDLESSSAEKERHISAT